MTPVRFLLSVPVAGKLGPFEIAWAERPELVLGHRPSAWAASGADRVVFEGGALFGRVFRRGCDAPLRALPEDCPDRGTTAAIAAWLTRETWGGWFALLKESAGNGFFVARDPAPLLPVYRLAARDRALFATDPALLAAAAATPLRVSWRNLRAHLLRPELRTARTCLEGVEEVAPGVLEPLDAKGGGAVRLWDPWTFAAAPWRASRAEAVATLRETAVHSVSAWTRGAGRVAVAASGGVDSSFVCGALAVSGVPFDCATVATADPSGDERAYVAKLAAALGVRAVARTFDAAGVELSRAASTGLPRPVRKSFQAPFRQAMAEAAEEIGADTVFDGNGGDNLFAFIHSSAPALDRLWRHGPGSGFARTVLDLCRLTGMDLATMLRALARRALGPAQNRWTPDRRLLACPGDADAEPAPLTDWIAKAPARMPGKRAHLALLMRTQNYLNDLTGSGAPFVLSPLLSQPLLELCISVPTWEFSRGGINRSLAREAFGAELPSSVTARVSKAGPDSFVREIFSRNRALLRELLLAGLLREHGLLDVAAIDAALHADAHGEDPMLYRLLDLAEAEAWSRSWN